MGNFSSSFDVKKPRTAEGGFRGAKGSKQFRIHPDVVIEEYGDSSKKFGSPFNNTIKKKKEVTIVKKVFVDKDGLLLKESMNKLSPNTKKKINNATDKFGSMGSANKKKHI